MTNMLARLSAASSLTIAIVNPGLAAHAADSANAQTPSRIANKPDEIVSYGLRAQSVSTIGSAASVITSDDIRIGQYAFAADALREAPGVTIARNGAYGGFASARLRGGSSGQTLVVIDGVVVNDVAAPQGGFNFANLDVADMERIEILRGPQSLIWGADAIGGVIHVRTRSDGPPLSAFAEGGARGTARGGATSFASGANAFLRATVSGIATDGVSRAAAGVEADEYRSIAASLTAGVDISANAALRVTARASDSHAEIDGFPPPLFTLADTAEAEDSRDFAIAAQISHFSGEDFEGALSLSFNGIRRRNDDNGVETFTANGERANAHYWGVAHVTAQVRLTAGAEYEHAAADVSGVDESATAGGFFALVEIEPRKGFILSAGARRDEFSNFEGATTSRVAAVWTIAESETGATRFRASWGQGYRAPTLFELNFDQFGVIPNPDLRPERANGVDVGVEQTFEGRRGLIRATYFRQRVKDQIDFDFAGSGFFNISRVRSEGVEAEGSIDLASGVTVRGAYAFIDAKDATTGAPILRTARHSGSATLTVSLLDPLSVSLRATFNGRESDFPAPNDPFTKFDVMASYAFSDAIEIYGRVDNAADKDYQDVSGFREPGRSLFAGLRIRL